MLTVFVQNDTDQNQNTKFTMCNQAIPGSKDVEITIPGRWDLTRYTHAERIQEIDRLARILTQGTEALYGLYMRLCDHIRDAQLTDDEIRKHLSPHFSAPRISEFIRMANAPKDVYFQYRAGFIGFRATLQVCRGYTVNVPEHVKRKKIRRVAERLVGLMGSGEVEVRGKKVTVTA